ncbi:Molybdenum cofactor biosynthesis protein 1 [Fusarium oxysporum f. sp. cubense]|uniref:Molybdenum cofactor biosynthesis protein 1 n=1 Tax=Fusarium oxysporum f. sp. cubense TaxID=61366 RepID=A0A559LTI0_FUSOC|nr:Molybdenum cofactor biosynthesis protein 1 [Fusarium oxysporum f. sp. cubense]
MSLLRLLGSRASVSAKTKTTLQRTAPSRVLLACPSSRTIATASARPQEAPREPPSTTPEIDLLQSRRRRIRDPKPFSDFLTDTFHRQHDYLRISVSERCNLRCVYCMPEEGVPLSPNRELLTTPEIVLLSSVFVSQGVTKIRLTGGEPTVRRDILPLMHQIGELRRHGLKEICITTNGISLHRKLDSMIESGLTGVNLSLDTLDPWQFQIMTRRKGFEAVQKSIDRILELNRLGAGIKLKINCVVMRGVNDREVLPFVDLTQEKDIEVRFIEYMPFDGNKWSKNKMFSYQEMLDLIRTKYPTLQKVQDHKNDTSKTWHIPGFTGRIGFITSMTHNFCGTCNRLRITGDGNLKVCLFGNAEVSLRDILRKSNSGEPIDEQAFDAMKQIEMDRRRDLLTSDRTPLGLAPNEMELLEVIGAAVKRKKAKHAGIGELEHMKNRPMILIDTISPSSSLRTMPPRIQSLLRNGPCFTAGRSVFTQQRLFSNTRHVRGQDSSDNAKLTHVSASGEARMVSISDKTVTSRIAKAACTVRFSNTTAIELIRDNQMKKGDVLGVARIAGIMASKRTPDLIPLCHPISLSKATVDLDVRGDDRVEIAATVTCDGKTGVEMEALTAASTAALTVYDMCKAVDKGMVIEGLRVVLKDGGKSGRWEME